MGDQDPRKRNQVQRRSGGDDTGLQKVVEEGIQLDCEPLKLKNESNYMNLWRQKEILVAEKYEDIQEIFTAHPLAECYNGVKYSEKSTYEQIAPANYPYRFVKFDYFEMAKLYLKISEERGESKTKVY